MALVQDTFDIPDNIVEKLFTGEYIRYGGIIRDQSGQIVKHLESVEENIVKQENKSDFMDKIDELIVNAENYLKNNKKASILAGVIVGFVAIGGTAAVVVKKVKNRDPSEVRDLKKTLKKYINAIRKGQLNIEIISKLIDNIDQLKAYENYKNIRIELSLEEIDMLLNKIYQYTINLANNNSVILTDEEQNPMPISNDNIINFQRYLKTQKRIFESVS